MKRRIFGTDPWRLIWPAWLFGTVVFAFWVASQFAGDAPCKLNESKSECHARRTVDVNPLILVAILFGWYVIAFVLPYLYSRWRR